MIIRQATQKDAHAIATVQVSSWRAAYRGIVPDRHLDALDSERSATAWSDILATPDLPVAVCEVDGGVVAFVSLSASRDEDESSESVAEIAALYVAPEVWRCGCGRKLCAWGFEATRARGFDELTLWVLEENAAGRQFWEAMGFRADGTSASVEMGEGQSVQKVRYRSALA